MKKPRIDEREFEEFRQTLPVHLQHESFRWLISRYDIPKALYLIKTLSIQPTSIDVGKWSEALGMAGERNDEAIHVFNGVSDKDVFGHLIDLAYPVIVVEHVWKNGRKKEKTLLLIDGNKRLRRAFLEGEEKLKAYFLPESLSKLIKL